LGRKVKVIAASKEFNMKKSENGVLIAFQKRIGNAIGDARLYLHHGEDLKG
jgi:hypothetical protein